MLPEVYGHCRKPQGSIGMVLGEGSWIFPEVYIYIYIYFFFFFFFFTLFLHSAIRSGLARVWNQPSDFFTVPSDLQIR